MAGFAQYQGRHIAPSAVAMLAIGLAACNRTQVVQGECRPVNGADVCVWGETTAGAVTAFGATIPVAAIENAPAEAPMVWPPVANAALPLPEAVSAATGFRIMTLYWEPHGHPPGPYLTPHFDFHFYAISADERAAIDCADSTKPAQLAAAYALPDVEIPGMGTLLGLCVPQMGMHSLPAAELTATALFQKTMIVGYYHGQPIFVEPMITRATLLERRSFGMDIPAVPDRPSTARYPTTFRADYDSTAQSYRFVFSGWTN